MSNQSAATDVFDELDYMAATATDEDATDIQEVRWYNTLAGVVQCNFRRDGTLEIIERDGHWCESSPAWLQAYYPEIVADIKADPVDGFSLSEEF